MNATNMVQGNLALKLETPAEPTFTVVQGGRSGIQPLTVKPARNQQAVVAPARVALKVPTIVAVAVALTLFFVLATSVFSARHAAYAESNITYETIRVQPGDSLWSLAVEYPIEGLSTQETSDMIRNVNHLEHGSLAAGAHLKVPARS